MVTYNIKQYLRNLDINYVKAICTVFGGLAIQTSIAIPTLFGSWSTYLTSSMHANGFYNMTDIGAENWIIGPFEMAVVTSMGFTKTVVEYLGTRGALLVSNFIFTGGYFLSYFAIQHSIWATAITYGVICGCGAGIPFGLVIDLCIRWFPHKSCTVSSILISGFGFCSLVFGYVAAMYINPGNLTPELRMGSVRMFNQTCVLDRIPSTFLVIGSGKCLLQFIGTLLSFTPVESHEDVILRKEKQPNSEKTPIVSDKVLEDWTPSQVLKDPEAYTVWFMIFFLYIAAIGNMWLYKNFGQIFISDDHYLTYVGSAASLTSSLYRLVLGLLADRYGYKLVHICNTGIAVILCGTWYQTKYMDKIWFLLWTICLYSTLASSLVVLPTFVKSLYGSKYFTTNFTILSSSLGISTLILPYIIQGLLQAFSWEYTILGLTISTVLGFIFSFLNRLPFRSAIKVNDENDLLQIQKEEK